MDNFEKKENIMNNVMIDLETLATVPQAAVLSIGAVVFAPETGVIGEKLHIKLDFVDACAKRVTDPATIKWWLSQDKEAQKALIEEEYGYSQFDALFALDDFLRNYDSVVVWGNGATFDVSILEDWYRQLGQVVPWEYYNVRDVRTIVALAEGIVDKDDIVFEGVKHDALADAEHQAKVVSVMWQKLSECKPNG